MKRKLIDYDVFQKIKTESLSSAQTELEAAAPMLAEALQVEGLWLGSFGPEDALFESLDGDNVHANYQIKNGFVQFDNIEQLVINEDSETKKAREVISEMIDALIDSNDGKADELFGEWMSLPRTKRMLNEGGKVLTVVPKRKTVKGKSKIVGYEKKWRNKTPKKHISSSEARKHVMGKRKAASRTSPGIKNARKMQRERLARSMGKIKKKKMNEWAVLSENVLGFVDYSVNGPVASQTQLLHKDGEVVGVRVPTIRLRNEARMLSFNWKTMNTDVMVKRNAGKRIHENDQFAKDVAELKKFNALSDMKAMEESIEAIATKYPEVLYITEAELAGRVKAALESVGASNYDDETCRFLSEGILRTVHDTFVDRVAKIVKLAGARLNEQAADQYAEFKNVAETFYSQIDEQASGEMQAYVDVYEALREIHRVAVEESVDELAEGTAAHLDELLAVIQGRASFDAEVLGEAAEWLWDVVESSMPEEWTTSEPVVKADGEHPDLAKKGRHAQSPASVQGETPNAHFTSDGKDYKGAAATELEGDGWSNIGGEGVYPSLDNPYVPKADVPKIVGEKDVDSDSDQLAQWGDSDTWPSLQNPYVKQSVTPNSVKE
jgi:hypothetical protein